MQDSKLSFTRQKAFEDPLPFSELDVSEWLFGKRPKINNKSFMQESAQQGPGELHKWKAFRQASDCYINKLPQVKEPKKKILLCNALLKDRAPSAGELALMSALVEYYDVYLWHGPGADLAKAVPLLHGEDFWRQRDTIQAATAYAVQQFFAEQQMAVEEWFTLDKSSYDERWGQPPDSLDLSNVDMNNPARCREVLASVDCTAISSVNLLAPRSATLKFVCQHFRKLHTIQFTKVSGTWLEKNIQHLQVSSIETISVIDAIPIFSYENGFVPDMIFSVSLEKNYGIKNLDLTHSGNEIDKVTISAQEELQVYSTTEISVLKNAKLVSTVMVQSKLLAISPILHLAKIHKTAPKVIKNITDYQQLISTGKSKDSIALTIQVEEEEDLIAEIFSKLAVHFTALKSLQIKNLFSSKSLSLSHPSLEYYSVTMDEYSYAGTTNIILDKTPRLTNLDIPGLSTNPSFSVSQALPVLRRLRMPLPLESEQFQLLSTLMPSLEYLEIDQSDNGAPPSSSNIILLDPLKEAIFSVGDEIQSSSIFTLRANKNLRSLTLDTYTSTIHLNTDDCRSLQILTNTLQGGTSDIRLTGSLPFPESLLVMDLYLDDDCPQALCKVVPTECVTNGFENEEPEQESEAEETAETSAVLMQDSTSDVSCDADRNRDHTFFSPDDSCSPDAPDGAMSSVYLLETIAHGRLKFTIETCADAKAEPIEERDYRIQIFDRIITIGDKLQFQSRTAQLQADDYQQFAKDFRSEIYSGSHTHKGTLEGGLALGKNYPLALNAPVADQQLVLYVEFNSPENQKNFQVGFHRDPQHRHYYVRLLPKSIIPATAQVILKLHYWFTPDKNYQIALDTFPGWAPLSEKQFGLCQQEKMAIAKTLADIPALQFPAASSIKQKIIALEKYFTSFDSSKVLQDSNEPGTLKQLLAIIKQQCGVCRHRAQAFLLLTQYMGIDAQLVSNGVHQYCEIRSNTKNWVWVELGGAEMQFFDLPPPATATPAPSLPQPAVHHSPAISYRSHIGDFLQRTTVFSWSMFEPLSPSPQSSKPLQPVLIYTAKTLSIAEIRRNYFNATQMMGNYLYIDKPADFARYWQDYVLDENGQRQAKPGPLQTIFSQGGTLLINWANFTAKQQIFYQSLWENPPRCEDKPITSRAIKIIGFLPEQTACPPGFASHCKICILPKRPRAKKKNSIMETATPTIICASIDLFNSPSWQELLIADIQFKGKTSQLVKGMLLDMLEAARKSKHSYQLKVHQPPENNDEFSQFLQTIAIEKRFFFNGCWVKIPTNFSISTSNKPLHSLPKKLPFTVLPTHFSSAASQRCYLHLNNWHTLYEQTKIAKNGEINTVAGRLMAVLRSDVTKTVFYISEAIPEAEWRRLSYFISQKFPHTLFQLQFAPGLAIPEFLSVTEREPVRKSKNISPNNLAIFLKQHHSVCLTSNDPDYLAEKLQALCPQDEAAMIIDLTPAMGVTNLLISEHANPDAHSNALNFILEKQIVFRSLEAGKTVILKGQLSPRLTQELLPLFSAQPYLDCNAERVPISGRLLLAQPNISLTHQLSVLPGGSCNFTTADYRTALLASNPADTTHEKIVKKILSFFHLAYWPHRGRSMPEDLGMSFSRLLNMKQLLLTQRHVTDHRHNRIKGLMLHDYEKSSEQYAFLNVLLKIHFDNNPAQSRSEKYQRLQTHIASNHHNERDYAWRLLNTCNGKILRELLSGKIWQDVLASQQVAGNYLLQYWTRCDAWPALSAALNKKMTAAPVATATTATDLSETYQLGKMRKRLNYLAQSTTAAKVVIIKGEPGVGKTHYLEQLEKNSHYSCSVGLGQLEKWLNDDSDKPKLLLLDEANTAAPGMLDFLDGIHRQPPIIIYQGKTHLLTPQHKIFAATNPEHFAGRYYHNVLRNGETILARMPSTDYLERWLVNTYKITTEIAKQLLAGAELFKRLQPLSGYSFRDLQNLLQVYRVVSVTSQSGDQILYDALYGEFAIHIADSRIKQQFAQALQQQFPLATPAANNKLLRVNHIVFPSEMQEAYFAIHRTLAIRKNILRQASDAAQSAYKRGLLLQSAPGMGKKYLCQQLFLEMGFHATTSDTLLIDPEKQYVTVTAGESNFRSIAQKAFDQGAILVVHHLNFLNVADEKYLGDLLMGRHEGQPAKKPGFFVLGTQNPSGELGGNTLSPALRNRMHILHLPEYSDVSWELLAQQKLPDQQRARQFAQDFWQPKQPHIKHVTGHDFFECLTTVAEKSIPCSSRSKRKRAKEPSFPPVEKTGTLEHIAEASRREKRGRDEEEELAPSHQIKKDRTDKFSSSSSSSLTGRSTSSLFGHPRPATPPVAPLFIVDKSVRKQLKGH